MGQCKYCICWRCSKATNEALCMWVDTLTIKPAGALTNEENTIIFCPQFEKETKPNKPLYNIEYLTNRERAWRLHISERKFYSLKALLAKRKRNISVEEYLKLGGNKKCK